MLSMTFWVTGALAYPDGLLQGKTMKHSAASGSTIVYSGTDTTVVTDGNEVGGMNLIQGSSTQAQVHYMFPSVVSIADYQLKMDGSATGVALKFYDVSGQQISNYASLNMTGTRTSLGTVVSGVKYVAVSNTEATGTVKHIYEFDVFSSTLDTTPPTVPSGFTATPSTTEATVNLSWIASTDAGSGIKGYNVYRNNAKITPTPISGTSYADTGLTVATTYSYQIAAVDNADNESARTAVVSATTWTPPDTTPPAVPTGLAAVGADGQVTLSWVTVVDIDLAGFNLYRGGSKVNSALIGKTVTSYNDTGLTNGTQYSYQISAVDTSGNESALSAVVQAIPTDAIMVNLVPNGTSIIVQVSGGTGPYTVTWGTGPSDTATFNASQYVIPGLTLATEYTVTVTDDAGRTYTGNVNTGSQVGYVPPTMPNPVTIFQRMIDNFGTAGTIALAVIGAAVGLGILVILGLYGWRLSKKWLSAAK
jgi:fibronectin type 3 domain-containing protein